MATQDRRKAGDMSPFSVTVDFGETVNLQPLTKTFHLSSLDFQTRLVDGLAAQATDVTMETAGPSAPLLSIWELYYDPTFTEVSTVGDWLGYFRVTYAGGETRFYPSNEEFMEVEIVPD